MGKSFKNTDIKIDNVAPLNYADRNITIQGVPLENTKKEVKVDVLNFDMLYNPKVCSDRFVNDNNEYIPESLDTIRNRDYIRDSNGNRVGHSFDSNEEVMDALQELEEKYSRFPGFKYYNQNLYLEPYKYENIQESGCCPTCFAMVATYLTGEEILPTDVVSDFYNYCFPSGTDVTGNCFPDVSSRYGLETERVEWRDRDAIYSELSEGNPIILNVSKGRFTGTGHYIVLLGLDENGRVIVADPNTIYNCLQTYSIEELISETHNIGNAAWSFKRN